jgi:hypothetical protein
VRRTLWRVANLIKIKQLGDAAVVRQRADTGFSVSVAAQGAPVKRGRGRMRGHATKDTGRTERIGWRNCASQFEKPKDRFCTTTKRFCNLIVVGVVVVVVVPAAIVVVVVASVSLMYMVCQVDGSRI